MNSILINFIKASEPIIIPIPNGISTGKYKDEIEFIYVEYTPKSIRIAVLLIPGITIPADIQMPLITKEKKLIELCDWTKKVFSISEDKITIKKAIIVNKRLIGLKFSFEFTFLTRDGMVPKINPTKIEFVWIGNL